MINHLSLLLAWSMAPSQVPLPLVIPMPASPALGMVVVRPLPLPSKTFRTRVGTSFEAEAVDMTDDGYTVDFEVVRWIDRPAVLDQVRAGGPIRLNFPMSETAISPTEQARLLQGRTFLLEVTLAADGRSPIGRTLWDLGTGDPQAAARVEVAGFEEVRQLHRERDTLNVTAHIRRIAARSQVPSLLLVLEASRSFRPDMAEERCTDVVEALLDLMLNPATPPRVALYAWESIQGFGTGPFAADIRRRRLIIDRLLDHFHFLTAKPDHATDRVELVLRAIRLLVPKALTDRPTWLPVANLDNDLETCRGQLMSVVESKRAVLAEQIAAIQGLIHDRSGR